jgi:hypothetical protein
MGKKNPAMSVISTRAIQAGAARVWQMISTPGYLELCHPFCKRNPVQRWAANGAADTIHYYSGRVVHRRFTAWLEGAGYDLVVVDNAGVEQAHVQWRIEIESNAACQLTVSLHVLFLDHLPDAVRWMPYRLVVRPQMKRYLEAVVAGVAHYAETGKPVVRNQFGSHRWFSPVRSAADSVSTK